MLVHAKAPFIRGCLLLLSFLLLFVIMLMPLMKDELGNHMTGLQYADNVFNELSKGSSYFIPGVRNIVKTVEGKTVELSVKLKKADLAELIAEVRDIVEILKWDYFIYSEEFPPGETDDQSHDGDLYGIDFTPPGCESVSLCFLSNRRMSDIVHLKLWGDFLANPVSTFPGPISTSSVIPRALNSSIVSRHLTAPQICSNKLCLI